MAGWNGATWSALGAGTDDVVTATYEYQGELVAGGFFLNAGGLPADRIARWNGATWSTLGVGVDRPVDTLIDGHRDQIATHHLRNGGRAIE